MKHPARRGVSLAIALAFLASPLMATAVEASHSKYYGDRGGRRGSYQQVSRKKHSSSYRGSYRETYRSSSRPRYSYRESYRSKRHYGSTHRHYDGCGHRGGSGIGPFVGGLAVGAIIGSSVNSCPPRRHVVHRRYVYHCDCCDYRYRSYDSWTEHLVVHHRVPSCDVRDYYPEYDGGYWEEY
jgi:hypothetical protein